MVGTKEAEAGEHLNTSCALTQTGSSHPGRRRQEIAVAMCAQTAHTSSRLAVTDLQGPSTCCIAPTASLPGSNKSQ
jgi:hypothetical protein